MFHSLRSSQDHVPRPPSAPGESGDDTGLLAAVRAVRSGVAVNDGFRQIDRAVRRRLERYFACHRLNPVEVDELVQTTLARVYLGMKGLDREDRFLSWVFTIARNVRLSAIERTARERRHGAGGLDLALEVADPRPEGLQAEVDREEMRERERRLRAVEASIEALPAQQKRCLLLRVRERMSYEEIAATLVLSVHTVRNHLAAARKSLRETLGVEEFDL